MKAGINVLAQAVNKIPTKRGPARMFVDVVSAHEQTMPKLVNNIQLHYHKIRYIN